MKTEREKRLEAALRGLYHAVESGDEIASWHMVKASEALDDEGSGGGKSWMPEHGYDSFPDDTPPDQQPGGDASKCPKCCGRGRLCLGGESAHPDNWYDCPSCGGSGQQPQRRDALEALEGLQRGYWIDPCDERYQKVRRALAEPAVPQHSDDAAVDRFAAAMKEKMARARDKGRGGWDDPGQCSDSYLAKLLVDHLRKGNAGTFEDVANFAMMLHQRGAIPTTLAEAANYWAESAPPTVPDDPLEGSDDLKEAYRAACVRLRELGETSVPLFRPYRVPDSIRRLPDELRQVAARFKETNYERGLYYATTALDRALAANGPVPAQEYEKQWRFWEEGDRFYHAKDDTWWRFDPDRKALVRADPPQSGGRVTEGWKLVPVELNEAMLFAGSFQPSLQAQWNAMLAAAPKPDGEGRIPEGWKLVPVEPTEKIMMALWGFEWLDDPESAKAAWRSGLAAAPEPDEREG